MVSKKSLAALGALLAALGLSSPARAENPMLHAANGAVVDAKGAPVLLRCVNMSPWLEPEPYTLDPGLHPLKRSPSEFKQKLVDLIGADAARAFWKQWEGIFATEEDFRRLAAEGFNCIRLPVNYKNIVGSYDNGVVTLAADGLAPVDRAAAWGAKYGLYVIIDLHNMPGGQNGYATVADIPSDDTTPRLWKGPDAAANRQMAVDIWRAVAAHYARWPSIGGYDLMNEPDLPSGQPKDAVPQLYAAMIAAIRGVDRDHMLILEGDRLAHDFSAFPPPPDPNIMYEFHEYAIFNRAWNTPNQDALQPFLQLRASSHMPLWLGEFGEESMEWQQQMVQLMKSNGIGWAIWPWKRIDLHNGHPVIEAISLPKTWEKLADWLVTAPFTRRPSAAAAQQGMDDMLRAIATPRCREDTQLESILAGR